MPSLPYFRWYAKDAETDEVYVSMSDEEVGFYHRLLNKAWINNGLPADLDDLARLMHRPRRALEKLWKPKVSRCWFERDGRLFNQRQEEERSKVLAKSEACAQAVRTRYKQPTDVGPDVGSNDPPTHYEPATKHTPRALARAESVSESESLAFQEFWATWPLKQRRAAAWRMWGMVVHSEAIDLVKSCRDRYLLSQVVANGKVQNLDTWLEDQARNAWAGDWPKVPIARAKQYTAANDPENLSSLPAPNPRDEIAAIRGLLDLEHEPEEVKEKLRKRLAQLLAELEREAS